MKLLSCLLASAGLVSICGASSFDLEVPALTYKAREPLSTKTSSSFAAPNFFFRSKSPWAIVPGKKSQQLLAQNSFSTMPIIAPTSGVDYKLTIVPENPTIDPRMLIPVTPKESLGFKAK